MIKKILNLLCNAAGHHWRYKDYYNWKKENGDDYDFKASRNCSRCGQNEYLYEEWKTESKRSPYDIKNLSLSPKDLPTQFQANKVMPQ